MYLSEGQPYAEYVICLLDVLECSHNLELDTSRYMHVRRDDCIKVYCHSVNTYIFHRYVI